MLKELLVTEEKTITIESEVRSYCRQFPATFAKASGSFLIDSNGKKYLDFLSGCGSLNYGHNHPVLKEALLSYIQDNGVTITMDLKSESKNKFLELFEQNILKPREMDYKVQFTGPTGANAVEAAIKLARINTGRTNIVSFTNGFHGCTLGSLSLTGSASNRRGSEPLLNHVTRSAYDGYFGKSVDTCAQLDQLLDDPSSGVDKPAAFIVESIQGEGGVNTASPTWLKSISVVAKKHGALLIIDDIQAGSGRSGNYFSFEEARISPDIITLAKSISGYGLPLSMVLMKPEFDVWEPGQHNGTFRGNNMAFVTAAAAIETFWQDSTFEGSVQAKSEMMSDYLKKLAELTGAEVKGRGMMFGLKFDQKSKATDIQNKCYEKGLMLETCGPNGEVLKFLPPLTATLNELQLGFKTIEDCFGFQTQ